MIFHPPHFSPPLSRNHRVQSKAAQSFINPSLFLIFTLETVLLLLYKLYYQLDGSATTKQRYSFTVELTKNILSLSHCTFSTKFSNSIIPPFSMNTNREAWSRRLVESGRVVTFVVVNEKERRIVIIIEMCCVIFTFNQLTFTNNSVVSSNGSLCTRINFLPLGVIF